MVSRVIPGYFLFCLFVSCHKKEQQATIKIAKTVPENYIKAGDSGFSKHQDTLYYGDHYFTGYQFSLINEQDTAFINSWFNGLEEGYQRKWYPHQQLAEERFYINGKKEGIHQGWWTDGKPKFYFEAADDVYSGEFKEWYSSGLLAKQFHYVNGQEEGSERLWWDNGTVRANYVIRNGKKYGLIGLTTCANPYDSVVKK
ncbi:MAG TPA: hypothetical protein VGO58_18470 [Chitinophagaceae bacterium]|nr:hypothetical protein [Chitinophagaceae bacterium]